MIAYNRCQMLRAVMICIAILILPCIVYAQTQQVSEQGVTITSDKTTYSCEPIFNEKGECLIKAKIRVEYDAETTDNTKIIAEYSTDITKTDYVLEEKYVKPEEKEPINGDPIITEPTDSIKADDTWEKVSDNEQPIKTTEPHTTEYIQMTKGEVYYFDIEFWAGENGKFDVVVENSGLRVVLDPYYEIMTNATTPSWYLIGGNAMTDLAGEFDSATDIATNLSDTNIIDGFYTTWAGNPISDAYFIEGYTFNELAPQNTLHSYTGLNDAFIFDFPTRTDDGDYYGQKQTGISHYIIKDTDRFNSSGSYTICARFKINVSSGFIFDNRYNNQGFEISFLLLGNMAFRVTGDAGTNAVSTSGTNYADDNWHIICGVQEPGMLRIYVDGVEKNSNAGNTGNVNSDVDYVIASRYFGSRYFTGSIAELGFWNTSLNATIIGNMNDSIGDREKAIVIDAYYNYSMDNVATDNYYLKIHTLTTGVKALRVIPYLNSTQPDFANYNDYEISTGWSYLSLNPIISEGYNAPLRVYSIIGASDILITEMVLVRVGNDTDPPVITACQTNTTTIGCGETARLSCNVTDDTAIEYVKFELGLPFSPNIINVSANKDGDIWYADILYSTPLIAEDIISWQNVFAKDLGGNVANNNPGIDINYTCVTNCTEDWLANTINCQANNSYLLTYYDNNSCGTYTYVPVDNGTWQSCNYCNENIICYYTTECYLLNGTGVREKECYDNNLYSCCAITNLVEDCSILYAPYNDTIFDACTYLTEDFVLVVDLAVFFGFGIGGVASDKVSGRIWINDTNTTYHCVSYVATTDGNLVQVNPVYTKRTDSTITLIPKEYEDREFFVTQNGLANVYWTDDNLVIDGREYIFGVECSGNGNLIKSEKLVTANYDPVNKPITRWFWFTENITAIIFAFIAFIIIIYIVAWAWNKVVGGR